MMSHMQSTIAVKHPTIAVGFPSELFFSGEKRRTRDDTFQTACNGTDYAIDTTTYAGDRAREAGGNDTHPKRDTI